MERKMRVPACSRISAFSLVELLAVVGIMGILFALTVPAVSSMMESNNLAQAGQTLADQVSLARQIASARNQTVEIRLIKRPASSPGYNAVQLWSAQGAAGLKAVSKITQFPKGTLIAGDTSKLSQALAQFTTDTLPDPAGGTLPFASFQVRPSGVVTPTLTMNTLFLTVVAAKNAAATDFPANYVMVQVNPLTGTPVIFRP